MRILVILSMCLFGVLPNINYNNTKTELCRSIEEHLYELTNNNHWHAEYYCSLKNVNGVNQYSYYLLSDSNQNGYLVFDEKTDEVVEFSLECDRLQSDSFSANKSDILYYFGPGMVYAKSGNVIFNVSNPVDCINIKSIKKVDEGKNNNFDSGIKSNLFMPRSTVWAILPNSLPNYSYNTGTICGSTAAAMMLRYMDLYVDGNFVPTYLESSNGVNLINHLVSYIENPTGSTAGSQSSGINAYLAGKVSYSTSTSYLYDYITYASITNGRPYIVNVYGHPTYGIHAMTAYAYSDGWPVVNDGWGNTSIYINPGYSSGIVVFN